MDADSASYLFAMVTQSVGYVLSIEAQEGASSGQYGKCNPFAALNLVHLGVEVVQRLGGVVGAHAFLSPADKIVRYNGLGFALLESLCANGRAGVEELRRFTGQMGSLWLLYPDIWRLMPNLMRAAGMRLPPGGRGARAGSEPANGPDASVAVAAGLLIRELRQMDFLRVNEPVRERRQRRLRVDLLVQVECVEWMAEGVTLGVVARGSGEGDDDRWGEAADAIASADRGLPADSVYRHRRVAITVHGLPDDAAHALVADTLLERCRWPAVTRLYREFLRLNWAVGPPRRKQYRGCPLRLGDEWWGRLMVFCPALEVEIFGSAADARLGAYVSFEQDAFTGGWVESEPCSGVTARTVEAFANPPHALLGPFLQMVLEEEAAVALLHPCLDGQPWANLVEAMSVDRLVLGSAGGCSGFARWEGGAWAAEHRVLQHGVEVSVLDGMRLRDQGVCGFVMGGAGSCGVEPRRVSFGGVTVIPDCAGRYA